VGAHPLSPTPTPLTFDHAWRLEPSDRRRTGCDLMCAHKRVALREGASRGRGVDAERRRYGHVEDLHGLPFARQQFDTSYCHRCPEMESRRRQLGRAQSGRLV
jgi:hypothetical protein